MNPSEASKKLEFHSKQICHGCVHPSMVGWCENHCQLPEAFKMAIFSLEKQESKKPLKMKDCKLRSPYSCPECYTEIPPGCEYCWRCGKKIDWDKEKEDE